MTIKKLAWMLYAVDGIQFLLGTAIIMGLWFHLLQPDDLLLYSGIFLMLLSCIVSLGCLFLVNRYQNWNYRESMNDLENLNRRLREQRHDYLNQLQIVYGLLELEEYEEAQEYLKPVFKDIMKVNRALKTAQPAVNALLQAKMETAEKQGIDFYLEVGTQLSNLSIEPWELCKVLGNLIDNAITAAGSGESDAGYEKSDIGYEDYGARGIRSEAQKQDFVDEEMQVLNMSGHKSAGDGLIEESEKERRITVEIRESGRCYQINVRNNGPVISEQDQKRIFQQGFTTKKGEGHGMGLAIVEAVLRENGGMIELYSDEDETVFTVKVPIGYCSE